MLRETLVELRRLSPGLAPRIEELANALNVSTRTLRRYLKRIEVPVKMGRPVL